MGESDFRWEVAGGRWERKPEVGDLRSEVGGAGERERLKAED